MTIQNINDTITRALPSGIGTDRTYSGYVNSVASALTQRQSEQVRVLTAGARRLGATDAQINTLLVEAGLVTPAPRPSAPVRDPRLDSIKQEVASALANLTSVINRAASLI